MATVIDSLLVTLGLDSSGMTKGAKEAGAAQDKIKRDAEDAAFAFKQQQAAAAQAFKKRTDDEVKNGKLAKAQAADRANAFKAQQEKEAYAFRKRQADEAKAGKSQQDASKKASEGLSKIRNEVLGIAAAFVGLSALRGFGEQLINADTHVNRLSQTLGLGAEDLNAWDLAASKVGISAESVADAFRNTNKFQEELKKGSSEATSKLTDFANTIAALAPKTKINYGRLSNKDLSAQERLIELSKVAQQLSVKDASLALAKLGYSEDIARLLQQGDAALAASLLHAKELDKDFAKAAEGSDKLSQSWAEAKNRVKGLGDSILVDVLPYLTRALDYLIKFLDYAKDHVPAVEATVAALGVAFLALGARSIAGAALSLAGFTGGLSTAATGMLRLIGLAGTWTLAITAAGAAGYAFGSLVGDGIDLLLTKLSGAETSLGTFLYKLAHPNEKSANQLEAGRAAAARKPGVEDHGEAFLDSLSQGRSAAVVTTAAKAVATGFDARQAAEAAEKKYHIPAAVTLAQYQLESNNGRRTPAGSNNPFGIKARAGQPYVEAETTEVVNGVSQKVSARFAKFDSLADAFDAHAKLLATAPAYAKARAKSDDPKAFADALTGVYATDPKYGQKLNNIIAQQQGPQIDRSIAQALQPGAPIDRNLAVGAQVAAAGGTTTNNKQANNSQVETHIGTIQVNAPNARTNEDVASAISDKLHTYTFGSNANTGLTA